MEKAVRLCPVVPKEISMPDCRYCGYPGAYDTGFTVECPNFDCDHYSKEQRAIYLKEGKKWTKTQKLLEEYLAEPSDEELTDPDITPTYRWGISIPLDSDLD